MVKYAFKAVIYKVGINPCVDVPERITSRFKPTKGYIPVEGLINQFSFFQTLVPVKNGPYRLFVNGPMMKGTLLRVGDEAKFSIAQNLFPEKNEVKMPASLESGLQKSKLMDAFNQYTPSRQKEIFKYLSYLKTEEALQRNIEKVIGMLKKK